MPVNRKIWLIVALVAFLCSCATGSDSPITEKKLRLMSKASESIAQYKRNILKRQAIESGGANINQDSSDSQLAYASVLNVCGETLGRFERRGRFIQYSKVAAVILGSFAGSIAIPILTAAAPAANSAWITGLGAISGLTNAAQSSFSEQGLSSESSFEDRRLVLEKAREALAKYYV